jgi:hypothetical protein
VSQQEKKAKKKKEATITVGAAKKLGFGLVIMFLLVWVFILGILTGKGDIHHLFQRLGIYKTDLAARLGMAPNPETLAVLPVSPHEEPVKALAGEKSGQDDKLTETAAAKAPPPAQTADPAAAKTAAEASKKPGVQPHQEAKRSKGLTPAKPDHDSSLASKLSFQNSLDTPARKPSKTAAKKEGAPHTASIAATPSRPQAATAPAKEQKAVTAYQVKVASYQNAADAEKALADLKKKGFKVSLQPAKDKSGTASFIIKTGRYNTKAEAEKVAQKLKEAKINGHIQELKQ